MLDDAKIADMRRGEMQNMINRLFYVLLPVHSGLIIHKYKYLPGLSSTFTMLPSWGK